ncbi:MAG: hypothetical protein IPJ11_15175 [Gemmatimonadetes bacterium]|nr:hypothetical protein [Gemmatimonadota bacterium]
MGDLFRRAHFAELLQSRDPARRRGALRAGHLAVQGSGGTRRSPLLAGEDTASARVDRAVALSAGPDRRGSLQVAALLLLVADSTVAWEPLVRILAAHSTADADRFSRTTLGATHATTAPQCLAVQPPSTRDCQSIRLPRSGTSSRSCGCPRRGA